MNLNPVAADLRFQSRRILWLSLRTETSAAALLVWFSSVMLAAVIVVAAEPTLDSGGSDLEVVASGEDASEILAATHRLVTSTDTSLDRVLDAMHGADPAGINRIMGVAQDIVLSHPPGISWMKEYVNNLDHPAEARSLVFRWIEREDSESANEILATALNDPAPRIRRHAINRQMGAAASISQSDPEAAIAEYLRLLEVCRHPKQVTAIAEALGKLDHPVKLGEVMGMMTHYHLIGPFENADGVGFNTVYAPEQQYLQSGDVDLQSSSLGKDVDVRWSTGSADENGTLDLASHFNKAKGATAYAFIQFQNEKDQPAQIRIKSVTANKAWVNGTEVLSNAVYHSGTTVDQYIADIELVSGDNTILIKTCQNEQTQPWAQVWELQCRITDPTGKPLHLQ